MKNTLLDRVQNGKNFKHDIIDDVLTFFLMVTTFLSIYAILDCLF